MFRNNSKINHDKNKKSKRKPLPEGSLKKMENNTGNIHVGKDLEMGQNASTPPAATHVSISSISCILYSS